MTMVLTKYANRIEVARLKEMIRAANDGSINHIYLHWSAGWGDQAYDDYHVCVAPDGSIYLMADDLRTKLAHTWNRNSGAIGIAMLCCADAQANHGYDTDFGPEPPTQEQIEALAKVVQLIADGLGISIDANHIMTHCEAAELDGYGPSTTCERWDLWYLPDYCGAQCDDAPKLVPGGDLIRGKTAWYSQHEE